MKKTAYWLLCLQFLSSCAHKQTVPVELKGTVQGIHIDFPEFLTLSKDDLLHMKKATQQKKETVLQLSKGQTANCKKDQCTLNAQNISGDFKPADLDKFLATLSQSKENKEAVLKDGPVTLRCLPTLCVADFKFDDDRPVTISGKGNATITTDYSGPLLGAFLGGMVGAALFGPRY